MVAQLHSAWVGSVLSHMPRPVVTLLDRWSQAMARRRAAQRRQAWLRRQAAQTAAPAGSSYRLKPWRD